MELIGILIIFWADSRFFSHFRAFSVRIAVPRPPFFHSSPLTNYSSRVAVSSAEGRLFFARLDNSEVVDPLLNYCVEITTNVFLQPINC